jgi:hypothetical protein
MRLKCFGAIAIFSLLATPGFAQNAPGAQPIRIRAIVTSYSAPTLVVKSDDGQSVTVTVPADLRIIANAKATLDDIKPGDFVGSAADKGPDGKLHAEEVHIFAEALRGTGEGHRPMAGGTERTMTNATVTAADRTMTNATVSGVAGAAGSKTLKLQYKDGEQEIVVAPDVPIVRLLVGDTSLLVPGATVALGYIQKDGGNVATNLAAEKDGVKPR